jgi:hypothetical protein
MGLGISSDVSQAHGVHETMDTCVPTFNFPAGKKLGGSNYGLSLKWSWLNGIAIRAGLHAP